MYPEDVEELLGKKEKISNESANGVTMKYDYDFIVIGSGPRGHNAAVHAEREGKKVVIIEKKEKLVVLAFIRGPYQVKL